MENVQFPKDDFQDVVEMADKLDAAITEILDDNDKDICTSALVSVMMKKLFSLCSDVESAVFFRHMMIDIMNEEIKEIKHRQV